MDVALEGQVDLGVRVCSSQGCAGPFSNHQWGRALHTHSRERSVKRLVGRWGGISASSAERCSSSHGRSIGERSPKGRTFWARRAVPTVVRLFQQEGGCPVWVPAWPLWKSALPPTVAHVLLLCDWLSEAQSSSKEVCARHRGQLQKNVTLQTADNQNVRLGQDGPSPRGAVCWDITRVNPTSCKNAEIHQHALNVKERTLCGGIGVSSCKLGSSPNVPLCHLSSCLVPGSLAGALGAECES